LCADRDGVNSVDDVSGDGDLFEGVPLVDAKGVEIEKSNGTSEVVGGEEGNGTTSPLIEGVVMSAQWTWQ
jgi:hypothetical protein